jgi:hypothetical protein
VITGLNVELRPLVTLKREGGSAKAEANEI